MKKAFLFLLLINGLFAQVQALFKNTIFLHEGEQAVPISKTQAIVFTDKALQSYVKKDVFLNLYLVERPKKSLYFFKLREAHLKPLFFVNAEVKNKVKMLKFQIGLKFGQINVKSTGIITDDCCALLGLVNNGRLIEQSYLKHFLKPNHKYRYFNAQFEQKEDEVVVKQINPFIKNLLKRGDKIIKINQHKIYALRDFWYYVLLEAPNDQMIFKIKRGKQIHYLKIKALTQKVPRYIADTFLPSVGIFTNEKLKIIQLNHKKLPYNNVLKLGDQIIKVNNKKCHTASCVREQLQKSHQSAHFSIKRKGIIFQTYLKVVNN